MNEVTGARAALLCIYKGRVFCYDSAGVLTELGITRQFSQHLEITHQHPQKDLGTSKMKIESILSHSTLSTMPIYYPQESKSFSP